MTKNVDLIKLPKKKYEAVKKIALKQAIESAGKKTLDEYNKKFSFLVKYFQRAISNGQVQYYIESKDVTYDCRLGGLTGNWNKTDYGSYITGNSLKPLKLPNLAGFLGEFPTFEELGYFISTTGDYKFYYLGDSYTGIIFRDDTILKVIHTYDYCRVYNLEQCGNGCKYPLFPVHHFHGTDVNITSNQVVLDLLLYDLPVAETVF